MISFLQQEAFLKHPFSPKSDVYSYSIVLWELVSRSLCGKYSKAFSEFNLKQDYQIRMKAAKSGLRPTLATDFPPSFRQLIEACWHKEPAQRPIFSDVLTRLNQLFQ